LAGKKANYDSPFLKTFWRENFEAVYNCGNGCLWFATLQLENFNFVNSNFEKKKGKKKNLEEENNFVSETRNFQEISDFIDRAISFYNQALILWLIPLNF
jgi:hypothetical protein